MTRIILGIETSCDETAAAIIRHHANGSEILSNIVHSQIEVHMPYGGVVPELAARAHLHHIEPIIAAALQAAGLSFDDLDAVAATAGPGLIGGLMIGLMAGKSIALAHGLPFIPINHLEGHALTVRLTDGVAFPYLLLLVSGGHCQLLAVASLGDYRLYGTTRDDAVGEAFDKAAKLLGLPYPGGPAIEARAQKGDGCRFALPRPMLNAQGCDFSFSGLKTALMYIVQKHVPLSSGDVDDLAASFQAAIIDCLVARTLRAADQFAADFVSAPLQCVIAGGVAANLALRVVLDGAMAARGGVNFYPPVALCTDNAAMIAHAAGERLARDMCLSSTQAMAFAPRARWPLAQI